MKYLIVTIVFLFCLVVFLGYHIIDQSIAIDHLQMSVKSLEKREICLLRVVRSFTSSSQPADFKQWVKKNLADLDVHEEADLLIVNEVHFDFSRAQVGIE